MNYNILRNNIAKKIINIKYFLVRNKMKKIIQENKLKRKKSIFIYLSYIAVIDELEIECLLIPFSTR